MKTVSTKIIVSPVATEETKKNDLGLVLPSETKNEGLEKVEVVYVGEEVTTKLEKGNVCFIYEGAGKEFTNPEDDKKYKVITVADILVIYE